ncbi:ABC transporter permease [Bacillus sp. REN16]|uniref:ABC transporter permease n=1 Tax=Bacillus sp. REN16 TaxID=2887296 RepID=UPI001E4D9DDC|nr:ABC transporter permease [Bacillus sp. REN16]MCC3358008.1 ABC transporter permease [Bacillus sp. REN16]
MNKSLFKTRFRKEVAYQWGVFRSVVDWTIFLYLFIPVIVIGGYHYYTWWSDIPGWFNGFPLSFIFGLLYLFCWQGRIRTFLEEADQLFLLQKRSFIVALKKWTRNLYVTGYSAGILFLIAILIPFFLNQYNLTLSEILGLSIYFISLKALILGWKQYLDGIVSTWKKGFYTILLFIGFWAFSITLVIWALDTSVLFLLIISILQWLLFLLNSSKRINRLTTFSTDVEIEKQAKLVYVKSIFAFSEYVEKVPSQKKRSPLFYRNSKRIYKKRNRKKSLQELCMKVFFRNRTYLFQCFQITSITTVALLVIPPIWIKCLIFFGFIIILRMWVKNVCNRMLSNHFIVNVRKDDIIRIQAEHYIVNFISFPVISIVGLVLILFS